jgi:hypothetical protein
LSSFFGCAKKNLLKNNSEKKQQAEAKSQKTNFELKAKKLHP